MNTIPMIVTKTGAIASGQLNRVYQGRSTAAPFRRARGRPASYAVEARTAGRPLPGRRGRAADAFTALAAGRAVAVGDAVRLALRLRRAGRGRRRLRLGDGDRRVGGGGLERGAA